jgi:RND family efflux transporter MFP subunit
LERKTMTNKLNAAIGLVVLAAAGTGIFFLFQGLPVVEEGETDEAGQQVKSGEVLFAMYDRPAKLAVKQTQMAVTFAEQQLERQKKLQQVEGTSARLVEEAKQRLDSAANELSRAKVELTLLKVKAPLDGTIAKVRTRAGESVSQGDMLAELVNLKQLLIKADIPSREVGRLAVGQRVEIDLGAPAAADRANVLVSRLDYIDFQVEPSTDTVTVLAKLPSGAEARPGQFVRVRIAVDERRDRLAAPAESVVTNADGETVIAEVRGDEAILVPVTRGIDEEGWVEVEGPGLKPDLTVVTRGAYGLPDKTKIRIIDRQPR